MPDIEKIIKKIDTLQPVSYMVDKIMEITGNPDSSLSELVEVIKFDPGITANILKICNSSYIGLKKKMLSIQQAVAYLGVEKVSCLAMVGSSAENFKQAQQGYDLNEGELWRNSVASAIIAQNLAEKKNLKNVPMIFTAALLKDIGKVILNTYVKDSFEDIVAVMQEKDLTFLDAEKEIIGIDHAELGAIIAEKWNFNPDMVDIIRNHHTPDRAAKTDLSIPIIYLADAICMMVGIGGGADGLSYRYHQDVVDRLNFSDIDLQNTIAEFWDQLKDVEELIKLSQGDI